MEKANNKDKHNGKVLKICITGARTTLNKGTASIIVSGIEELNKLLGNAQFIIFSPSKDIDSICYHNTLSPDCNVKVIGISYYSWIHRSYPWRCLLVLLKSIPKYFSADIIVDMRGEGFRNASVSIFQSIQLLLGVLLRKLVVVYAQSLGPFQSRINKLLAKFTLRKMSLITIREPVSVTYFQSLGIDKQAYLCGDQAFLLRPAPSSRVKEILRKEKILDRDKPLIGISPFF